MNEENKPTFEKLSQTIDGKTFDCFSVTFKDGDKIRTGIFKSKMKLGERTAMLEIVGQPKTDMAAIGFQAAFTAVTLDGIEFLGSIQTKDDAYSFLDRLDDEGLNAYAQGVVQGDKKSEMLDTVGNS